MSLALLMLQHHASLDAVYLDADDVTMAGGFRAMHLVSGEEIAHCKVAYDTRSY